MKSLLKKNIKQDYTIDFKQITGVNLPEGTEVVLKWRRGEKKENKGSIEKAQVHGSAVLYQPAQSVNIHCTLFMTKNGYEEKGLELSLHTIGKKGKELYKGYVDLAKYADLNGVGKDLSLQLKGKTPATVDMKITSLVGEAGGSSDETEVLHLNQSTNAAATTTDIHELLVQQVDKKNHEVKKEEKVKKVVSEKEETEEDSKKEDLEDDEKEEQELAEKQRKQKEIQEKEEAARQQQIEEKQMKTPTEEKQPEVKEKSKEKNIFAAAASGLKIKGKKDKNKKKFTQEDVDKAIEKALKEKKEKHHKKTADLKAQLQTIQTETTKEKESAIKEKDVQIEQLNKKIIALEDSVKEKETIKSSLEVSLATEVELKGLITKKDQELKNKDDGFEKEKGLQNKKIQELENQNEDEKQKVKELESKIEKTTNENKNLMAKVEDLEKKLIETEKNAASGSESLLKQKNQEIENTRNEKGLLEQEINKLKEKLSGQGETQNLLEIEKNEKDQLKKQNEKLKQEISKMKEQNELFEKEISEKEASIIELQKAAEETNKSSSSSSSEDDCEKENAKTIKKLITKYQKCNKKYENNVPVLAGEIKKIIKGGDEEIKELDHLKDLGDNTFESAIYLLLTFAQISNKYIVEKVERDGSLKMQILDLEYSFFIKTLAAATMKLNGFLESMMKDNQCFERRKAAEFEQVTAAYIPKYLLQMMDELDSLHVKDEMKNQLLKQIMHYVSYHVIELLIENEKLISCAKGLQLKFFFSIMEAEMSENKKLISYREFIQPAIEVSGLLVLDHSPENFNYKDLRQTLPHLSGSVIYAILSRFKTDKLNQRPIEKSVLDVIDKNDVPLPSAFDLI